MDFISPFPAKFPNYISYSGVMFSYYLHVIFVITFTIKSISSQAKLKKKKKWLIFSIKTNLNILKSRKKKNYQHFCNNFETEECYAYL